mgnify:CR=1 FL=1
MIIAHVSAALITALLITALVFSLIRVKDLNKRIDEQADTITYLTENPSQTVELTLNLTDKSRIEVNGKNNQGTISVPTDRVYELVVDSLKVTRHD